MYFLIFKIHQGLRVEQPSGQKIMPLLGVKVIVIIAFFFAYSAPNEGQTITPYSGHGPANYHFYTIKVDPGAVVYVGEKKYIV